jgi:4-amino-4-deoxy-L-arabinose transferase-like glycosyltransferase
MSAEHQKDALPRAAWLAGGAIFAAGVVLRALYVLRWHRPVDYLVSDMEGYVRTGRDWLDPAHVPNISDTVYPPGTAYFFGFLNRIDPSLALASYVQLAIACAIPVVIWAIADELFDRRVALVTLPLSSLFYSLFDLAGYILSENPFTLLLLVAFWLLARSLSRTGKSRLAHATASGLVLGLATAFKSVALGSAVFVVLVLILRRKEERKRALPIIACAAIGLAAVLAPLSVRATRLNEGRFCLVANETSRGVLIGHHGDIHRAVFEDRKRNFWYEFGNNTALQRGRNGTVVVQGGPWDNEVILAEAWAWTKAHPADSLRLSFEHVHEIFVALPWPSDANPVLDPWVRAFRYLFQIFILFPALGHLVIRRKRWPDFEDLLVAAPVMGVVLGAFLSVGESRYRLPFDGFIIILAARAYVRAFSLLRRARGAAAGSS